MGSLNKIQLIGKLGQDAELKTASTGNTFLSFSIATIKYTNKGKESVWHNNIQFWSSKNKPDALEKLAPYMSKGTQIYVEGTLDYYKDKDKITRVNLKAHIVELLGNKSDNQLADPNATTGGSVLDHEPVREPEEPPF
ncbi:single-stranded DNA-binding protein [uncultured Mediterranean phage uvMED]|nr:single-stranded DNA-binding protein [uncultured Mediterranean phage uvMED]BAR16498.1 single-stranded DNA-binding protein (TIGR00621) [uncultured Mediterranean phage uvMED]